MFDDALVSLMVMLLLSFAGMLIMFLFILRSQSSQSAMLREWFRQHHSALAEVEQQLMNLHFTLRQLQQKKTAPQEQRADLPPPSGDLRDLFGPLPEEKEGGDQGLRETRKETAPERDYSYPSAAGLDPVQGNFLDLPLPPAGKKDGGKPVPPELEIKLDR
ncbi:MAG: hypothetical protein LBO77_00990 [Desulfovibrio sp.]|jgi:hypothetical protein|nr:hypothetical protein [Desulfovibrio sp.]